MEKKITKGIKFVTNNQQLFACPLCHQTMVANESGLTCENQHRFDVSKKGSLFFLQHPVKTEYDQKMFTSRQQLIQGGMYAPLIEKLATWLAPNQNLLDVGCGEGSFLKLVLDKAPQKAAVGFDISKEGVYLATNQEIQKTATFWCVADLTNLPFAKDSFDSVLNIFSPSNYREFQRILKPNGSLLKVVPGPKYLQELRQAFYPEDEQKQHYSNQPVVDKFTEFYPNYEKETLTYEFQIPQELRLDLLEMSPLEWGVSPQRKEILKKQPLSKITVDLLLLKGENIRNL